MTDSVDAFLAHHLALHPVDGSFMGFDHCHHLLPPTAAGTEAQERRSAALLTDDAGCHPSDGHPLDRRLMAGQLAVAAAALDAMPRFANPAWYTGEAAFGVIVLLLPQSEPIRIPALLARLAAIPDFLADGRTRLAGQAIPAGWAARAQREAAAMAAFFAGDIASHPAFSTDWAPACATAAAAFSAFAAALAGAPDRDPACGTAHLALLMRHAHALDLTPETAEAAAQAAFDRLGEELAEQAARIDPRQGWQEQLAALGTQAPADAAAALGSYRHWHDRALAAADGLVTPEFSYGLDYRRLAPWCAALSAEMYFLFYRCPPAASAGAGSTYWVGTAGPAAHPPAVVKTTHAVHHGSIGHHTQNARARAAPARLARLAGTDCALGIAFLAAGTMVEGWACHAVDLLAEAPGFYTPAERLLLKAGERRNAASVLVDVRLHTGAWSQDAAIRFYRDEAGFPAARVAGEVVRNSMLPGTRLMYWLGVEAIRDLRRRWRGSTVDFHDALLGHGHVPIAYARDAMLAAAQIV